MRLVLSAVSTVQLATGIAGMTLALKRRHAYHLPLLHGRPDKVPRDSLLLGTALSAPVAMLTLQGVATARLLGRSSRSERPMLGCLGATMVVGYFAEALVRERLRRSGWDRVESPLVIAAASSAAGMAVLGLTSQRSDSHRRRRR